MPELSAGAAGFNWLAAYVLVAAGVLVLLGILLWLSRRSSGGEIARKAPPPARRLAVVDQIALDEKRRLVLIQREGVQHLVILGGANELLVESGIGETRGARVGEPRDLRAHEPVREVPELPAFPSAPARETPPLAAPSVELAARQPAFAAPIPPSFSEPPRRAAAPEAAAPVRPAAPPRSEPPRPQPAPPMPTARRAEPAPVIPAAPMAPAAPILPPVPQPVVRAEPEPVRAVEAPVAAPAPAIEPEPATVEPETPAAAAESAKASGLLARLRRSRQSEPAEEAAAEPAPLRDPEPAVDEPRRAALELPDLLPEMPAHSVPEVVLEPPVALEPESQPSAAPVAARVEPDMSKLFEMIVPDHPAAASRPAAPAAPPAAPREEPPASEPAETPRVAVKIDPFFANMAQRLEETLRRPVAPGAPPPVSPAPARPATNAAEIERVIDLALSAPDEPGKSVPVAPPVATPPGASAPTPGAPAPRAPDVAPPPQDELEAEMANLLGRSHR